jgi:capsular exopolysaccharide synthesis family protein
MVAGLALGFGGAMLLEHFDDRVRRVSDAREASGLEVVGTVPRIPSGSKGTKAKEIGMEAFRGIRTNLRYVMPQGPQLLGVCSPAPREGKSTVTANLALSMVENGDRVLVVDADLRRARMHELLGVEQTPGLSEVLAGKASLADAIRISPLSTALHVLPSGSLAVGVSTLNDHKGLRRVFESLRERYDLVIVDTPPLLVVNDSSIVASEMDGNIIVVRSDGTNREALVNAVSQLHRVNARLVGLILNDLSLDSVGYSAYYDSYYQGTDEKRSRIGRRRRTKALTSG